jgi:3-oxoadipate enol-lactonase
MPTVLDPNMIKVHRSGSGPALVLLHCLGVDHRLWDHASAGLAGQCTVLSYDFPGHGETPLPAGPYTIEDLSAQLAAVLEREGIARAHVAGISLGGLVAQHFAATYPDRTDGIVLIDTTPRYTDEVRENWHVRAKAARTAGVSSLIEGLLPVWFTPEFIAKNPPAVRYVRDIFARDSGEGYALACEALAAAELRPLAPNIKAPTLVVCGEQDVPPFLDAARWLEANIRGARLAWLASARHCSVLEQPEAFLRLMREFLG